MPTLSLNPRLTDWKICSTLLILKLEFVLIVSSVMRFLTASKLKDWSSSFYCYIINSSRTTTESSCNSFLFDWSQEMSFGWYYDKIRSESNSSLALSFVSITSLLFVCIIEASQFASDSLTEINSKFDGASDLTKFIKPK